TIRSEPPLSTGKGAEGRENNGFSSRPERGERTGTQRADIGNDTVERGEERHGHPSAVERCHTRRPQDRFHQEILQLRPSGTQESMCVDRKEVVLIDYARDDIEAFPMKPLAKREIAKMIRKLRRGRRPRFFFLTNSV